jgi:hypothetical protein
MMWIVAQRDLRGGAALLGLTAILLASGFEMEDLVQKS